MGRDDTAGTAAAFVGRFAELEDVLVERVHTRRAGRALAPVTVVVGSAAVRTHVGDLLVRRSAALVNVKVVTLTRLAADLVTGGGRGPGAALTGVARERLVRRVVARCGADGLAYFGRVAERPHFAAALAATFADLREARIAPRSGWAQSALASAGEGRDKAADLDELYGTYCDELERRGLADRAAVFLAAAGEVERLPPQEILLYGFHDFNQAQEAFVAALVARGADLFVPVPRGGGDLAAPALAVARAAGLEARCLEPCAAGDDLARIAAVWQSPSGGSKLDLAGDGSLRVVSVADERGEAREAVRAVLAATARGAAFWDCAVVAPHGDEIERLAAALEVAGLPVACRRPERAPGPRIIARLADCLVPPAGPPLSRRAVIELLTSAPLRTPRPAPCEAALWLDEARQAGVIGGAEHWAQRLSPRLRGLERRLADLEARAADPDPADEAAESVARLRVRLAATRGLERAAGALVGACAALPARAAWGAWVVGLSAVVEALFDDAEAGAAREVLRRLAALEVLGEEVELAEVMAVLREQMAGAGVPVGIVGRRGVAVLTPLELRGLRFHTVVFTGLAEGGFPARGRPDPILGDVERRRLNEGLGARLPLAEARNVEATLLFALACEAARAHVTLLASRTDAATGRPRLPSRLLLRLASLAAGVPVGLDDFLHGEALAPVWRHIAGPPAYSAEEPVVWVDARERDTAVLLALSGEGSRTVARDYLADVLDGTAARRRLAAWRAGRSPEPGSWDGLLGDAARAAVAARHPFAGEMHPTRLERYLDCPFSFLLRDVLGLDGPDEPESGLDMDAREFGTLAHEILQRAYQEVIERGLGCEDALAALHAAWEQGCAAAEARGVTGAALAWVVRRQILLDDLRESVGRDPVFTGDGRPIAVEWRFGEAAGRAVTVELSDGRRICFAGRLDRIDETARGARVVDYKTGRGGTERQRLKAGTSVQLPVYQAAVRQALPLRLEHIACAYRLVTRRGGFEDLPLPNDEAAVADRLRRLLEAVVRLIDGGVFVRSTAGRCEYCDVGYACGLTSWARARKREHEALRALVDLQRSGPEDAEGGQDSGGDGDA